MQVAGIDIELIQKDIKNLHLAVYPPNGKVRLAAPVDVNLKTLELYVTSKLPWIRKQQRKFAKINRESPRQYLNRESHYFLGKRYLMRVNEVDHLFFYPRVELKTKTYIDLYVKENSSTEQKADILKEWYRSELKRYLLELVPKWEKILGVKSSQIKVRAMKTKWGSCNTNNGNILFNIELVKKPLEMIEYVVVHELLHLHERTHNDIFTAYLDKYIPNWKFIRESLNS